MKDDHRDASNAKSYSAIAGMLTAREIDKCRKVFERYDADKNGAIDMWELRNALREAGQEPTDEELMHVIAEVDINQNGRIELFEFLLVIAKQKKQTFGSLNSEDNDVSLNAFVAMGGKEDKTGSVSADKLRKVIKDFELTIDIETFVQELDQDNSGFIDYDEFKALLSELDGEENGKPCAIADDELQELLALSPAPPKPSPPPLTASSSRSAHTPSPPSGPAPSSSSHRSSRSASVMSSLSHSAVGTPTTANPPSSIYDSQTPASPSAIPAS